MYLGNCVLSYKEGAKSIFLSSSDYTKKRITIENCVFTLCNGGDDDLRNGCGDYINCTTSSDPIKNDLAHYVVENYCDGVVNKSAFGCNNDTCIDEKGCEPDTFKLPTGDDAYTEKHHPEIDTLTPTPTVAFSQSNLFSTSLPFFPIA